MRRRRRSVDGEGAMRLAGGLALLGFLSSVSLLNAAQLPAAVPAAAAACTSDIQACRGLADGGDAEAQFGLGVVYGSGSGGVDEDDVEAARWYRRAAEAARWVRLAADQGLAVAQFDLALRHTDGRGVPQDDNEAVRWFRLAAMQRHG